MALKQLSTGYYIKIDLEGNIKIYKTATDRKLEKAAPNFATVKARYRAVLNTFYQERERLYYDPIFSQQLSDWEAEFLRYNQSYVQGQAIGTFPLMRGYIKNIKATLPTIVHIGKIRVKGASLEEVYNYVKKVGYFGEVKDC